MITKYQQMIDENLWIVEPLFLQHCASYNAVPTTDVKANWRWKHHRRKSVHNSEEYDSHEIGDFYCYQHAVIDLQYGKF